MLFDIQGTEAGKNTAYLAANKMLYTVNLDTGNATEVGAITGTDNEVRDIAVLPGNVTQEDGRRLMTGNLPPSDLLFK